MKVTKPILKNISQIDRRTFLLFIVLSNLIVYVSIIFLFPGFFTDDYIIFSIINKNSNNLISTNPKDIFYLFSRPVSYFSFWLDYHLWYTNAYGMKFFSLFLHIACIYFLFATIENYLFIFFGRVNYYYLTASILLFSIHIDVLFWIQWITNRTELLSTLFYILALFNLSHFLLKNKKVSIILFILFYLLSALSKQQGLHLPFAILFLNYFLKGKYTSSTFRAINYASIIGCIIFLILSLINYIVHLSNQDFVTIIWKKPFTIVGIVLQTIFPLFAQNIYNFFVLNKVYAAVLLLVFLVTFAYFAFRSHLFKLLPGIVGFLIIISFPRLFSDGGQRINTIFLFWMIVGLNMGIMLIRQNLLKSIIVVGLLVIYSFAFITKAKLDVKITEKQDKVAIELNEILTKENVSSVILVSEFQKVFPYQIYYLRNHSFGRIETDVFLPVGASLAFNYYDEKRFLIPNLRVDIKNNVYFFESLNPLVFIDVDKVNPLYEKLVFSDIKMHPAGRGFESFTLELPYQYHALTKIYYNGEKWSIL